MLSVYCTEQTSRAMEVFKHNIWNVYHSCYCRGVFFPILYISSRIGKKQTLLEKHLFLIMENLSNKVWRANTEELTIAHDFKCLKGGTYSPPLIACSNSDWSSLDGFPSFYITPCFLCYLKLTKPMRLHWIRLRRSPFPSLSTFYMHTFRMFIVSSVC